MTDHKTVYAQRQLDLARTGAHSEDKEAIARFLNSLQAQGVGERRLSKYIGHFMKLMHLTPKTLTQLTGEEIDRLLITINTAPNWRPATKRDYQACLKKFYRFLDGNLERAGRIRVMKEPLKLIDESEVLTEEEITRMENATRNARERAIVRLLFETAARLNEFVNLRIGDVTEKPPFLIFNIHGTKNKYAEGKVPVNNPHAIELLRQYLETHPRKHELQAPLWLNWHNEPLEPRNLDMFLRGLGKRTGITKRTNPHWFRHSKITQLRALGVSDSAIRLYARWSKDSRMLAVYDHSGEKALMKELEAKRPQTNEEVQTQSAEVIAETLRRDKNFMQYMIGALTKAGKVDLLKPFLQTGAQELLLPRQGGDSNSYAS